MALDKIKTLTLDVGGDGSVIFDSESVPGAVPGPTVLSNGSYRNFIGINSAQTPSGGAFRAYVELVENGGFHKISDLGGTNLSEIDATKTGAQVADGEALGWEFYGPSYRIKVVAIDVTGVSAVAVEVIQFIN